VLRQCVLASGAIFMTLGCGLLIHAGVPVAARILLVVGWIGHCVWQMRRQALGHAAVVAIRLSADGLVTLIGPGGHWQRARLITGTIILDRVAWLRLARPGHGSHGELCRASRVGAANWHRFRLISAQAGPGLGNQGRA
jgi:hypothetical protein